MRGTRPEADPPACIANITNGTGLTGGFRFGGATVHDDSAADTTHSELDPLSGGAGSDWFLYNFDTTSGGKSKDVIADLGPGDARTDLA
jgi:hypothetical protein